LVVAVLVVVATFVVRTHADDDPPVAGCPPLLKGTTNAAADYADILLWRGTTYGGADQLVEPSRLGAQVTTVDCSIAELTSVNHNLVGSLPWPDRTATFLPSGAPVFAIRAVDSGCRVSGEVKNPC